MKSFFAGFLFHGLQTLLTTGVTQLCAFVLSPYRVITALKTINNLKSSQLVDSEAGYVTCCSQPA